MQKDVESENRQNEQQGDFRKEITEPPHTALELCLRASQPKAPSSSAEVECPVLGGLLRPKFDRAAVRAALEDAVLTRATPSDQGVSIRFQRRSRPGAPILDGPELRVELRKAPERIDRVPLSTVLDPKILLEPSTSFSKWTNGIVIPVSGISLVTPPMMMKAWMPSTADRPAAKSFPKPSVCASAVLNPRPTRTTNSRSTATVPNRPSSSPIAAKFGCKPANVLIGCGSTQILRTVTFAFASPSKPLVAGSPTYEECSDVAALVGAPIRAQLPDQGCLVGDVYLPALRRGERIATSRHEGGWDDVGTLEAYLAANLRWLEARRERAFVGSGARVASDVELDRALVGAGAEVVGRGALRRVVVWPGATARAPLEDAIVTTCAVVRVWVTA